MSKRAGNLAPVSPMGSLPEPTPSVARLSCCFLTSISPSVQGGQQLSPRGPQSSFSLLLGRKCSIRVQQLIMTQVMCLACLDHQGERFDFFRLSFIKLLIFPGDDLISECGLIVTFPKEEDYFFKELAAEQYSQSLLLLCQDAIPSINHPLGEAFPENICLGRARTAPSSCDSKESFKIQTTQTEISFLVSDTGRSLRNLFGVVKTAKTSTKAKIILEFLKPQGLKKFF